MDIKQYLKQFNVIGHKGNLHCENLSQILYATILNKFRMNMTQEEYVYFKEYQERVFDLVENLRELPSTTIPIVFDHLTNVNHYLIDIIIMLWCLPRTDDYLSKKMYNKEYRENIQKYHQKMVKNICHKCMENFCIETITKTNNVPVHCIDYIWFYMNNLSFDFTFYNSNGGAYINFTFSENDKFINFGFNMEYLLELGLGQIVYHNDPNQKGSFRNFLQQIITNMDVTKKLLETQVNFRTQFKNISKNPAKYFGENFKQFPKEIIDELEKYK